MLILLNVNHYFVNHTDTIIFENVSRDQRIMCLANVCYFISKLNDENTNNRP